MAIKIVGRCTKWDSVAGIGTLVAEGSGSGGDDGYATPVLRADVPSSNHDDCQPAAPLQRRALGSGRHDDRY
jgi:hypothetical protein